MANGFGRFQGRGPKASGEIYLAGLFVPEVRVSGCAGIPRESQRKNQR